MAGLRHMKFVFIFVTLVSTNGYFCRAGNTSGNQKMCTTPGTPININVGNCAGTQKGEKGEKGERGDNGDSGAKGDKGNPGTSASCKCNLQDSKKPSAHLEASSKGNAIYQNNQVIKDWSASAPNSHIAGGMTYKDGKLTVPTPGRYYIYAQFYYHDTGRIYIRVNNNFVTMLQPPYGASKHHGALYAGGVFKLKAGDVITVVATNIHGTVKGSMGTYHSYFGAFLI